MKPNSTVKQSLTVEPVVYAAFAENGNIRMWCRSAIGMCELLDEHGNKAVPLYTSPPSPDAELVSQCIAEELSTWEGDFQGPVQTAMRCLQVRIDAKLASLKP